MPVNNYNSLYIRRCYRQRYLCSWVASIAFGLVGVIVNAHAAPVIGAASVHSNFGMPLYAEIEVFDATPSEVAALKVREASDETYRSRQATKPDIGELTFGAYSNRGLGWISVVSERPVNSARITILLEVVGQGHSEVKAITLTPVGIPHI